MKMKEIQKQMLAEAEIFAKANVVRNLHCYLWNTKKYIYSFQLV